MSKRKKTPPPELPAPLPIICPKCQEKTIAAELSANAKAAGPAWRPALMAFASDCRRSPSCKSRDRAKSDPVRPSANELLAHGIPGRVGILRGYGNAIVPAVAAAFIRAFLEAEEEIKDLTPPA